MGVFSPCHVLTGKPLQARKAMLRDGEYDYACVCLNRALEELELYGIPASDAAIEAMCEAGVVACLTHSVGIVF